MLESASTIGTQWACRTPLLPETSLRVEEAGLGQDRGPLDVEAGEARPEEEESALDAAHAEEPSLRLRLCMGLASAVNERVRTLRSPQTVGPNENNIELSPALERGASDAVERVDSAESRRDAIRQMTRENMQAEVRQGLVEGMTVGTVGVICLMGLICMLSVVCLLCCFLMNVAGAVYSVVLFRCDHQQDLRRWLLVRQGVMVIECLLVGCASSCLRSRLRSCAAAIDQRVRPGFTKTLTDTLLVVSSSAWKIGWSMHTQALVARAPTRHGAQCGESLPLFMDVYSHVLLLQVLMVQPTLRLMSSFLLWAARRGILSTTRGAKPGTLEGLPVVEYSADLFADPKDPSDDRPLKECPICLEDYGLEEPIIKTHCGHLMHRGCLGHWLQASHFCPICRTDVEMRPSEP